MIILEQLEWSNFFSYGENNCLNLSDQPVTQLLGLNGHGKSSIPLIIEELLYNKNSKGVKKGNILNRESKSKKYSGSLSFRLDNTQYKIEVTRTGANQKVSLIENGKDISAHTATDTFKLIESILGVDFKTFSQIVYQNSTSSLQFLTATDTNRKKFLIDLLSLEKYVELFERVKDTYKQVSDSMLTVSTKLKVVESSISKLSSTSFDKLPLVEVPEIDPASIKEKQELEEQLASINTLNAQITSNNQYRALLNSIDTNSLASTLTEIDPSETQEALGGVKQEKARLISSITKYKKLTFDSCPTCYQSINRDTISRIVDEASKELSSQETKEAALTDKLNGIKENNRKHKEHQALVSDFEKYSRLLDNTLPTITYEREALQRRVDNLKVYIKETEAIIKANKLANDKAIAHNAQIALLSEQLKEHKSSLSALQEALASVTDKVGILEILRKAFSTNGLIAYKIENSVKELQELTNSYLTELSDGRFQLAFGINNDKLNVIIVDNGVEIDIAALSAGELTRVTTSTLLAIRKLMAQLSKSRINLLFLDETIDVLDAYGKERLIEVLLKEELNTFLISHSYSHPLIKKLHIVKEQGASTIQEDS